MPSDERLAARVHRFAGVAACVSMAVGFLVVLGWAVDDTELRRLSPGPITTKPNTAIAFALTGLALWLVRDEGASTVRRVLATTAGVVVAVFALLTLVEYVFGVDLGIDGLLRHREPGLVNPGRPSPHTGASFLTIGTWIALLDASGTFGRRARETIAALACITVMQAAIGYLFGVGYLYRTSGIVGVAPTTLVTLLVLCGGMLAARPRRTFMGLLTSAGAGGHAARRLVPAVLVLPLLIGYVRLRGQEAGWFGTREGVAITAGSTIILIGLILMSTCRSLDRSDAERRALEAELQALAERDPLTNLYNRRRFDEQLAREVALARRSGAGLAVLMIDVDGLKHVNDTQGHAAGDALLLGVAETLGAVLRETDVAARLGGDEFAVLLPATRRSGAAATAERLLGAMREAAFPVADGSVASTVSVGVAVSGRFPADGTALLRAADEALYAAKRSGRDAYRFAGPQTLSAAE